MKTTRCRFLSVILVFAALIVGVHAAPGDLDLTFGTGGKVTTAFGTSDDWAYSAAVQPDSKIVVAGYTKNGSDYDFALARYTSNGSLDTTFNGSGMVTTYVAGGTSSLNNGMALQADGKIVVAGARRLVRYTTNGSLDTTFNGTGSVATGLTVAFGIAVQGDGRIVIAGYATVDGKNGFAAMRYNTNGTLDTSFNGTGKVTTSIGSGADIGHSVALQSDGKIVLAGYSSLPVFPDREFAVVRYNANGSLDTSFNGTGKVTTDFGSGDDEAWSVSVQSDGRIIVSGSADIPSRSLALVRYNANGSLDTSFNGTGKVTGAYNLGYSVAVQADGKILVAGSAAPVRYNTNGSLDTGFNGASGGGTWSCTSLQSDGKIVVAGWKSNGSNNDFAVARYLGTAIAPPTISGVSPNPVPASSSQQIVTINGTNFVSKPTVTLTWTGQPNYTVPSAQITYLSASQVQMAITVSTTPDNWTVKVTNPGGATSNVVGFQVVNNLPFSPTNMEAQAFSNRVELGWGDNSTNETGFKIERRTGAGAYSQIATTGANATSSAFYTDNTTSPRTTYTYRVRTYNGFGDSGYTNEVTATTPGGPPGAFTLSNDAPVWDASIPGPKVQLNWTPSFDVGNYAVYRNGTVYQAGIAGTAYLNSANLTGGASYTYFIRASNADGTTDSNTVTVTMPTGPSTGPEIVVESPLNTNITDGGSKSFGSVVVGANTSLTFTIKNTGTAGLTGLTMTKNGTDAGMFSITSYPTAPVSGPSGSNTFTVRFTPTSAGSKSAAIHIANNDSDENPFDITLTGSGVNAQLPISLAIQGPANVAAGDTANYTCIATYADTSTVDVSGQVAWSVSGGSSGTYMNGSTLVAGSGAASTANITASIGSASTGLRTKTVTVTINSGLSVSLQGVTATYLSGTGLFLYYRLDGTAAVQGASGNVTAAWIMDGHTPLTGTPTTLSANVFTTPGNHEITLTITDAIGIPVSAKMSVRTPKAPQVDEQFSPVAIGAHLPHPGRLFETNALSGYDANSEAKVARRSNGLVIIIHGMDNGVTDDFQVDWMKRTATAIQAELVSNPPNIILYDWKDDAAVTSVSDEVFQAIKDELGQFSATSLTIRSKLLQTAADNLVASVGFGLTYAVRVASLRPNGEAHGQALADYLAGEILEGRVDPSAPIHLIGHSAGGFVASNCGRLLMASKHWNQPGNIDKKPVNFQVTTLDTPILQVTQIRAIRNKGGRFDRYVSSAIGELQLQNFSRLDPNDADKLFGVSVQSQMSVSTIAFLSPSTPEFSESATYHHGIDTESAELAWFFPVSRHVKAHEWYIHTVQTPNSFREGFYYAPLPWGNLFPGAVQMPPPSFSMSAEPAPAPPASMSGLATFGNVSEAGAGTGSYTLTEQGNAGIYQAMTLPMNVSTVKFRIQFTQAGDGDFIEVSFGDHLSLAVVADGAILRAGPTEFEVPVVAFGGETGQILIKLNGVGADNAIAVVDNISITTDDDADSDGLTFAQETSLGTDPRYYDTDSDGIGDWEEVYTTLTNPLLADSDGDGMTDAQEIIAGTSGMDATSVFRTNGTTRAANGNVTITWAAKAGKTYRVQRSDAPNFANYTVVGDSIPGVEPTTNFTDGSVPNGAERMFYRVEVE